MDPMFDIENATLLNETDRAYLIDFDGLEVWIPKSQAENVEIDDDKNFWCSIPQWLADSEGLA